MREGGRTERKKVYAVNVKCKFKVTWSSYDNIIMLYLPFP